MSQDYHEEQKRKNTLKLRQHLSELPEFLSDFFRGISDTTEPRTKIGYAYDLKIFFRFLSGEIPLFDGKPATAFDLQDLARVTTDHIQEFMEYVEYYSAKQEGGVREYQNGERTKSRKLAAVRVMFSYYYKKEKIPANPAERVDYPKLHEKAIIRLDVDEVAKLLDVVENGDHMTAHQKKIHNHTMRRDLAMITLLLGTGMRVSECVGINLEHLDFDNNCVKIVRKGGNEAVLYFGEEVAEALLVYIREREGVVPLYGHENALFLSSQRKRITDRAIQLLVKKYAGFVTGLKKITPHKLRSTYGTNLYRESGDIYLVADVLGHADVNTTKKHYAAIDEDRRKSAAKYIKLRKE